MGGSRNISGTRKTSPGDWSLLFVCSEEGDCSFKPRGGADATDGNFFVFTYKVTRVNRVRRLRVRAVRLVAVCGRGQGQTLGSLAASR